LSPFGALCQVQEKGVTSFDLSRFVDRHRRAEGKQTASGDTGYVFPRLRGVADDKDEAYALGSLEEAKAYLEHPQLSKELSEAVRQLESISPIYLAHLIDPERLLASLTLFAEAGGGAVFDSGLRRWFNGQKHDRTLRLLGRSARIVEDKSPVADDRTVERRPATLHDDLRAEYLLIQNMYEAFDQRALSLKSLATPLLGAGVAIGVKEQAATILVATALVALCLWFLEGLWKSFQYCLVPRIKTLEAWFRGPESAGTPPFQVYAAWHVSWAGGYSKLTRVFRIMLEPFVSLPYAIIVILSLGLAIVSREGWLTVN
jgi:uncharacterized protein (DUF1810 family)